MGLVGIKNRIPRMRRMPVHVCEEERAALREGRGSGLEVLGGNLQEEAGQPGPASGEGTAGQAPWPGEGCPELASNVAGPGVAPGGGRDQCLVPAMEELKQRRDLAPGGSLNRSGPALSEAVDLRDQGHLRQAH